MSDKLKELRQAWKECTHRGQVTDELLGELLDGAFNLVWRAMADEGHCDEIGGMEWERVSAEWVAAGRPASVTAFIQERANIGSQ